MDPVSSRGSQALSTPVESPDASASPLVAKDTGAQAPQAQSSSQATNTVQKYLPSQHGMQGALCRASAQPFSEANMSQGEELKLVELLRARQKEHAAAALGGGVELCKRTADLPVARNLDLKHHWLRTSTKEAGMGPADGGVPGNRMDSPFVTQTRVNDHSGQGNLLGATCERVPDVDEGCVNRELELGKALGAWSPVNQCQTFAAGVLEHCSTKPQPEPVLPDTRRPHPGKI